MIINPEKYKYDSSLQSAVGSQHSPINRLGTEDWGLRTWD